MPTLENIKRILNCANNPAGNYLLGANFPDTQVNVDIRIGNVPPGGRQINSSPRYQNYVTVAVFSYRKYRSKTFQPLGPWLRSQLQTRNIEFVTIQSNPKNDEGNIAYKSFVGDWADDNSEVCQSLRDYLDVLRETLGSVDSVQKVTDYNSDNPEEIKDYIRARFEHGIANPDSEDETEHRHEPTDSDMNTENQSLLESNLQIIYFGAPGTGKSHKLKGEVDNSFPSRYERVTFYPTYSYAQFVGCYKPTMRPRFDDYGEEIAYEFVPGPFLRVLVNALNEKSGEDGKKKDWCLVIEEINRANAAAVFGDVFQLLDRDGNGESEYSIAMTEDMKRHLDKALSEDGKKSLQELAGEGNLKIPSNMYIWATMNSADQGVFPMDTAFKRRWEFEYIGIDEGEGDCAEWTIEGQNLNWNKVRRFINDLLALHGVNEDKLMGAHFVKAHDKVVSAKTFASKVLMYLWEDAARMCRRQMFRDLLTYSSLVEKWGNDGIKVFKNDSELEKLPDDSDLKQKYAELSSAAIAVRDDNQEPLDEERP